MQGDFSLGEWLVQPSLGRATKNGNTIYVRAKVMDLLVFLAQRPGEVVPKTTLLDGVWGTEALSESALTRSIAELRQAFGDDAERPSLLETIPKRGYRLIAPVRPLEGPQPPTQEDTSTESLQRSLAEASTPDMKPLRYARRFTRLVWAIPVLVVLAAAGSVGRVLPFRGITEDPPLVRFLISPPDGMTYAALPADPDPAISPDGRQIATIARAPNGDHQIWIHALDSLTAHSLPGTEGAQGPFWSPDGQFIGFFAQGKLRKIRTSGGPPETLCDAGEGFGATWSHRGVVLFAPNRSGGLYRVPSSGGVPVPQTTIEASVEETSHRFPQFLPDGRRYIYLVRSSRPEAQGIYVGSTDSTERKRLTGADSNAVYVPSGYLLFVRETVLVAQRFDARRLEITGEPVPIAEGVLPAPTVRFAPFSASGSVLTFRTGGMHKTRLVWVDREGRRLGTVGAPSRYLTPALSPDGTQLAVDLLDLPTGGADIWAFDLGRNVPSRLTSVPSLDGYPIWTVDGKRIIFASNREGIWNLYERNLLENALDGTSGDRLLLESGTSKYPQGWSPDGEALVYVDRGETTGYDIWKLLMTGKRKPMPLLQTSFSETQAQVSPDGRWLAYVSDESGPFEVYVRPFSTSAGGKWRISKDGGCQPRWRGDGKELFYLHGERLLAVEIEANPSLKPALATDLFGTRVGRNSEVTWDYVAAQDGQRFLFKELVFEEGGSPMVVILNWQQLVAR